MVWINDYAALARAAACPSLSELQQFISITAIISALTVLRGVVVQAAAHGVELLLPQDIVVAQRFAQDAPAKVVAADAIPDGWLVRAYITTSWKIRLCSPVATGI